MFDRLQTNRAESLQNGAETTLQKFPEANLQIRSKVGSEAETEAKMSHRLRRRLLQERNEAETAKNLQRYSEANLQIGREKSAQKSPRRKLRLRNATSLRKYSQRPTLQIANYSQHSSV